MIYNTNLRDAAVERIRVDLQRRVRMADKTQRAIEQDNGYAKGYLSQVLHGNITLTARHILGILMSLDISPTRYFAELFPDPEESSGEILSQLQDRRVVYDSALRQLEAKGLIDLEPLLDED